MTIVSGGRIKVEIWVADQIAQMQLNIVGVILDDFKTYRCVAKNTMGESIKKIRLLGNCCHTVVVFCMIISLALLDPPEHRHVYTPPEPDMEINLLPDHVTTAASAAPTIRTFERYTYPQNGGNSLILLFPISWLF